MLQHKTARGALDAGQCDGAAQDRHDVGGAGEFSRQRGGRKRMRLAAREPALGLVDHRDHLFIGIARVFAVSEGAVFEQDHAGGGRRGAVHFVDRLRQREAWHHIGDDERFREQLADQVLAVRLVGEADDGVGVGVIDVFVGEIGMQDRLDRRRRRGGIEQ